MKGERHLYFLRAIGGGDLIKIGSSAEPESRLRTFMAWSPLPVELLARVPGTFQMESRVQDCFADAHSHCEWFHPVPRLIAAIEALQAGVPLHDAIDLDAPVASVRAMIRKRHLTTPATSSSHVIGGNGGGDGA